MIRYCADLLKNSPTLSPLDQVFDKCLRWNNSEVVVSQRLLLLWMDRSGAHMQHCWMSSVGFIYLLLLLGRIWSDLIGWNKKENVWNKPALYLHVRRQYVKTMIVRLPHNDFFIITTLHLLLLLQIISFLRAVVSCSGKRTLHYNMKKLTTKSCNKSLLNILLNMNITDRPSSLTF